VSLGHPPAIKPKGGATGSRRPKRGVGWALDRAACDYIGIRRGDGGLANRSALMAQSRKAMVLLRRKGETVRRPPPTRESLEQVLE
jgi:hypothetical protein